MIASYTLDEQNLDEKFILSLKQLFHGKRIRITVNDEDAVSDSQNLRLLESLEQSKTGKLIAVDIDKFL